jgi:manganese-dependent inorganic pyrophosphatase
VGSVNTILYDIYNENNIEIPASIAGIMASSIISDTLLLTSPTTTEKDRIALRELSKIAGIDYNEYGVKLLKQGMSITNLTNEQILYKDFKTYKVDSKTLGIGQVLTSDFELIDKDAMVEYLDFVCQKNNYNVVTLFVTDIFNNISYCLYNTGSERIIKNSFDLDKIYEGIELKNILSRKVQIAPYIMESMDGE